MAVQVTASGEMEDSLKRYLRAGAERFLSMRRRELTRFPIARPSGNLFLDHLEFDPCGLIRIVGWSNSPLKGNEIPQLSLGETLPLPALQHYRFVRPDIDGGAGLPFAMDAGVACEYLVPQDATGRTYDFMSLRFQTGNGFRIEGPFEFIDPHYRALFDSPHVFHREEIYCSGPPNASVNEETRKLALKLDGPILDFGCGSGALVSELLERGIQAYGLELDTPMMRSALRPGVLPHVTFYDGQFPVPFDTGSFRSVFCSEVLEHIPDFRRAIEEISRIASEKAIFTVPNASAIPLGFRHQVVPWHLMEGTHVNFFNQTSLESELKPHFRRIEFGRVGAFWVNDSLLSMSISATCWK